MDATLVDGLNLEGLTRAATDNGIGASTYRLAFALVALAFLYSLLLEILKMTRGEKADLAKPVYTLIFFIALLGFYRVVVHNIIELISSLGSLRNVDTGSALAGRAAAWQNAYRLDTSGMGAIQEAIALGQHQLEETIYTALTTLSYVGTSAVLWTLKIIQKVMTEVLIAFGPFIIALSAFPGPTRRLLQGWFMALIEVTAWGLTARILASHLNAGWASGRTLMDQNINGGNQNPFEHIVYNLLYAFAFLMIPVITAVIVRGMSASGLGQQAMGGFAAAAGTAVGAVSGAAGAVAAKGAAGIGSIKAGVGGAGASSSESGSASGGGAASSGARAGDAGAARRAHFARDGAIRKQERES